MHTYAHMHRGSHACAHVFRGLCACMCIESHVHAYACMFRKIVCIHACMCPEDHACTQIHTCSGDHKCVHACMCAQREFTGEDAHVHVGRKMDAQFTAEETILQARVRRLVSF